MRYRKMSPVVKWVAAFIALILIGAGGYFGYQYYQDYKANKIYSVNETVRFPDFDFTVTKAEFKPVNLDLNKEYVKKYGDISKKENCNKFSDERTYDPDIELKVGPSKQTICHDRNIARKAAQEYQNKNSKLVIDYEVLSKSIVNSKDIKFRLTPDGGRDITKKSDLYLGGFQKDAIETFVYSPLYKENLYMLYGSPTYHHRPHKVSKMTGDINKDLKRKGYIHTDMRSSERTVDLKISYKGDTRLVRIKR